MSARQHKSIDVGFMLFALLVGFVGVPSAVGLGVIAGLAAAPPPLVGSPDTPAP